MNTTSIGAGARGVAASLWLACALLAPAGSASLAQSTEAADRPALTANDLGPAEFGRVAAVARKAPQSSYGQKALSLLESLSQSVWHQRAELTAAAGPALLLLVLGGSILVARARARRHCPWCEEEGR